MSILMTASNRSASPLLLYKVFCNSTAVPLHKQQHLVTLAAFPFVSGVYNLLLLQAKLLSFI